MKKRPLVIIVCLSLIAGTLLACGPSDEEKRIEAAREWELSNYSEGVTPPPKPKPLPNGLIIEVPESVKGKFKTAIMGIGNRKTREVKKFKVGLGSSAKVPDIGYTVEVGEYLPNWSISGNKVTSRNDKPDDPAVRAIIYDENGDEVFNGFIFQKHKTPSYYTDEFVIGLLGAE